jgi:predicted metal-binding protein
VKHVTSGKPIKRVRADWDEIVLVCRKCSKKLGGGFGKHGDQSLAKGLRKLLGAPSNGRKAGLAVIEVDCLDVCPKGAVVALRAAAPGDWAIVPKGAALPGVAIRLGLLGAGEDEDAA